MKKFTIVLPIAIFSVVVISSCDGSSGSNDKKESNEVSTFQDSSSTTEIESINIAMKNLKYFDPDDFNQTLYDDYHLMISPFHTGHNQTEATFIVALPKEKKIDDSPNSVLLERRTHLGHKDMLYTIYVKNDNAEDKPRIAIFELDINTNYYNSCDNVAIQLYQNSNRLDKSNFYKGNNSQIGSSVTVLYDSTSSDWVTSDVQKQNGHDRTINEYYIIADMPGPTSFSNGKAFTKILTGTIGTEDITFSKSYVTAVNDIGYYYFDFELKGTSTNQNELSVFDIPVVQSHYNNTDYYVIQIVDSNGNVKKKKVIIADPDKHPFLGRE